MLQRWQVTVLCSEEGCSRTAAETTVDNTATTAHVILKLALKNLIEVDLNIRLI